MSRPTEELYEKDYQSLIVEWAAACGWSLIYHTHDSRRSRAGFPDLVMIRRDECMVLEIKGTPNGKKGTLSKDQAEWIQGFKRISGVNAAAVWPEDWDELQEEIR